MHHFKVSGVTLVLRITSKAARNLGGNPAAPVALKKVTIMFMISMTNKLTIGDDEQFIWIISCALLGSKCLQVGVNGPMVSTLSTQRGN